MLGIIGALLIIIAAFNAWQVRDIAGAKVSKEFEERFGHYSKKFEQLESEAKFYLAEIRKAHSQALSFDIQQELDQGEIDEISKLKGGKDGSQRSD